MTRFLNLTALDEVLALVRREFPAPEQSELVPLLQATGRVTSAPLFAAFTVPEVPLASMDGFAVRSSETRGARETAPLRLPGAVRVNTGNPLPPGMDAVVMIEEVDLDGLVCVIRKPARPNQNVRLPGEETHEGDMVLPPGHRVRPFDIGALASYGINEVPVRTVKVGLIPTGGELVPPGVRPAPGQVVESNTLMAEAYLRVHGVLGRRYPIVPDEPEMIRSVLADACGENDLVIISAGSSAGTRDYTSEVLSSLGEVLVHGIAMKPGKPAIIARIAGRPVIGLPGYPVSAQTVLREVVSPLLTQWGFAGPEPSRMDVILSQALASDPMTDDFVAITVGVIGGRFVGLPQSRGAAVQMAGLKGNAILRIPASAEGIHEGETVSVSLMVPESMIGKTLIFSGVTDPAVDLLISLLRGEDLYPVLTRSGNIGAIRMVLKAFCHAGVVNFRGADPESGVSPYMDMIRGQNLTSICLAEIPLGLVSRNDIAPAPMAGTRFLFREAGSVPQLTLETFLTSHGIAPGDIPGPRQVARSHEAVAAAVADGVADAGISTNAVAARNNLLFTPLTTERLEMIFTAEALADPRVATVIEGIRSPAFLDLLHSRTHYCTSETGVIRPIGEI